MVIDHFDSKSIKRRPLEWLSAAVRDAKLKYDDCVTPQPSDGRTFPAHAAMWSNIAGKYQAEIDRRSAA